MNTEDVLRIIENLEKQLLILKEKVNEIDERTKQFKRWSQTSHPDFDLGS